MHRTIAVLLAALISLFLFAGCSKPWSHEGYSGATADDKFKTDSLDCQVIAGEEFPLNKLKQQARYKACMNDRGWQHDEDNQGIRFETKPR
ncbi:MAG: hypothetical protein H0S80_08560 [Desulfovibrionaceae bacterium]|nr:hypothetical protein [Desulfovibrionaceae bacterium]